MSESDEKTAAKTTARNQMAALWVGHDHGYVPVWVFNHTVGAFYHGQYDVVARAYETFAPEREARQAEDETWRQLAAMGEPALHEETAHLWEADPRAPVRYHIQAMMDVADNRYSVVEDDGAIQVFHRYVCQACGLAWVTRGPRRVYGSSYDLMQALADMGPVFPTGKNRPEDAPPDTTYLYRA